MNASPLHLVSAHPGLASGVSLFVKRDDLLHPEVQGNKWRKLAPLLATVRETHPGGIITFGGPFSNHLHAVAAAGRLFHIPTFGIVRGEHADRNNPTLRSAAQNGMMLFPVSKHEYDTCKDRGDELIGREFPRYYILPEGGATAAAVDSCAAITWEILTQLRQEAHPAPPARPLFICTPAGTGCTAAGIVAGLDVPHAHLLVFPVVNRGFDAHTILRLLASTRLRSAVEGPPLEQRFSIIYDYECGGFAKFRQPVLDFAHAFQEQTGILLDPIYTTKMMLGIFDMLARGNFPPNSTVVALHTGGLQGWEGVKKG
ncbi:MAG: pyridoxal-phosphate dependent enzyme [Lewinellaceae bacterium]|nr:pyridoxal-phosphate dependent enzyme [Lewinellaceae bacterium]